MKLERVFMDLLDNLTASPIGWSRPIKETLLGPIRTPANPRILRSNRVTKATETKNGTTRMINLRKLEILKGINHYKFLSFTHKSATLRDVGL